MDNVTQFPDQELDMEKTLRNIARGSIDHVVLITLDEHDVVNVYTTAEDTLLDVLLETALDKGEIMFTLDDEGG